MRDRDSFNSDENETNKFDIFLFSSVKRIHSNLLEVPLLKRATFEESDIPYWNVSATVGSVCEFSWYYYISFDFFKLLIAFYCGI